MANPVYDPDTNKPVYSPDVDKPSTGCLPLCPEICDDAEHNYSITFSGTLTNEDCGSCSSLIGTFVLTPAGDGCADGFCCWQYVSEACEGIALTLAISDDVATLEWRAGIVEVVWGWERDAEDQGECSAAALEANLAYDASADFYCSGWGGISFTID